MAEADERDWAEAFKRSPEDRERERKRLEAEVERLKEQDGGSVPFTPRQREADPRPLSEVMESALSSIKRWDDDRRHLPCIQAMYQPAVPDGYLTMRKGYGQLAAGAAACDAAAARAGCAYAIFEDFCAIEQVRHRRAEILANMSRGRVEKQEYDLIKASIMAPRVELKPLDALQIVRRFLVRGERSSIELAEAAEVDPLDGQRHPGIARFSGDDRLLVMGGNNGRGKTVAACYAISKQGGLYMVESLLARKGPKAADMEEIKNVPGVLVVDHVGLAEMDEARTPVLRLIEIVDKRASAGLRTILCGNFDYEPFAQRYRRVLLERVAGFGLMVLFAGESLRAALRQTGA